MPNSEPPLPTVDDHDFRRRAEEELQRVLEMSIHDRGGCNDHASAQSSHADGSGSGSGAGAGAYCLRSHLSIRLRFCAVTARSNFTYAPSLYPDIPCTSCGSGICSCCDMCTCVTHL